MTKGTLFFAIAVSAFAFTSCVKDPLNNLTQEESRIYITNYDSTANFSAFQTFSVADSVAVVENGKFLGRDLTSWDASFISALKNKMQSLGYTLVSRNDNPDLGVTVSSITNTSTGIISYDDYTGGYGGYWDPYYWDYPGSSYYFPTYYGVYNISEGAVSVDMFDLKDAEASNQLRNVWTALIRGSGIFNSASIDNHVQTLFAQSAYIKK